MKPSVEEGDGKRPILTSTQMQSNPDISEVIWKSQKAIESKHLQKLIENCNMGFCGRVSRLYALNLRKLNYLVMIIDSITKQDLLLIAWWFRPAPLTYSIKILINFTGRMLIILN